MKRRYKFLLAALLLLGLWCLLPSLRPARITGIKFHYAPGDLSHGLAERIDVKSIADLKLQKDTIAFASRDQLTVFNTTTILGFSGEDVNAKLQVAANGSDLVQVERGPRDWEWLYRPSAMGRVTFHCRFFGPGPFPGLAFDITSEVNDAFGLPSWKHNVWIAVLWAVGLLSSVGLMKRLVSPSTRRKDIRRGHHRRAV
jgi:hypothetical protein